MYGIASARLLDATESKSVEAGALQVHFRFMLLLPVLKVIVRARSYF